MSMKEVHILNGKETVILRICILVGPAGWKPSTARLHSVPARIVDERQMWNVLPGDKHHVNNPFLLANIIC